ncbi:response regulator transcription factor [Microlunatus elymi]|uniref:response regulator transcription factor n=1 Tax=Microlunatus elymi TaxID=2596828 RepID=UPI001D19647F|nr:response regulator transcription factor [Microlunatus elymi]
MTEPPAGRSTGTESDPSRPTRILIVDDDPIVRSALGLMLGGQPDFSVVGEAINGRDCLAQLGTLQPDLILMDLRMPVLDGIRTTREITAGHPTITVIALTTFDTDDMVLAALSAGADGFLLKDTPPAKLVSAIRAVRDGEPILSPSAVRTLLHHVQADDRTERRERARARLAELSERELEVAMAIADGANNAEIAGRLQLSVPTVKTYVSRLLDRLELNNRVQIAICVQQAELTP